MRRAIIVGAAGQDGRLLTEHLRRQEYEVVGVVRHPVENQPLEGPLENRAALHVDVTDGPAVTELVRAAHPDEIYYLAAFHQSSEGRELRSPASLWDRSTDVHLRGLIHFLEALRAHAPGAHLFYAASSLVFGEPEQTPQNERTPLNPTCVYGITKAAGVHACRFYRREHGLRASAGFLYNHESHLRAERFLSARITDAAIRIQRGQQRELVLGNLSAQTDWGYAPDYVDAMQRIVQLDTADDFVIATGELRTVQDFAAAAFGALGLDWRAHVREVPGLITRRKQALAGDAARLRERTGWSPSTSFDEMVRQILRHKGASI